MLALRCSFIYKLMRFVSQFHCFDLMDFEKPKKREKLESQSVKTNIAYLSSISLLEEKDEHDLPCYTKDNFQHFDVQI